MSYHPSSNLEAKNMIGYDQHVQGHRNYEFLHITAKISGYDGSLTPHHSNTGESAHIHRYVPMHHVHTFTNMPNARESCNYPVEAITKHDSKDIYQQDLTRSSHTYHFRLSSIDTRLQFCLHFVSLSASSMPCLHSTSKVLLG